MARVAGAVRRADRAGVVIVGPAGVGKSRLLVDCMERGRSLGFEVVHARASSAASDIPFGALAALLPSDATRGGAEALAGAHAVLREAARGRPLLLAVDDAHQLDDASALLVHQLAADFTTFVALTVRLGEPVPDPITALWKDELAERVEVGPLPREHVTTLLGEVLGGPVDAATDTVLWRQSDGNALYLHELVVGALDAGDLVQSDGMWTLRPGAAVPARLVDVVQARLRNLDDDERRTLSLVAFGEPIGVALLEQVSDLRILERLERLGLIVVAQERRRLDVRLAHPLHGEVLRRETPALQSRALHRTLADLLEGTGARRREDGLRLAVWRLEGGGAIAAERLVAAATAAREAGDVDLAERLARAGVDAGGGFAASFEVGQCLQRNGEHAAALAVLDALVGAEPDDDAISALADSRADITFWALGREADGMAILEHALGRLPVTSPRVRPAGDGGDGRGPRRAGRSHDRPGVAADGRPDDVRVRVGNDRGDDRPGVQRRRGRCSCAPRSAARPPRPAARGAGLDAARQDGGPRRAGPPRRRRGGRRREPSPGPRRRRLDRSGYGSGVLAWTYTAMGRLDAAVRFAVEASALFRATQVAVPRRWTLASSCSR